MLLSGSVVLSKVCLMVMVGAIAIAQVVPSCGGEELTVIGWVARKTIASFKNAYIVEIDNVEYEVPEDFYAEVRVGDLVKLEHGIWKVLRKAGS